MLAPFIISSIPVKTKLPCIVTGKYFLYSAYSETINAADENLHLIIDGFVLPVFSENCTFPPAQIIEKLFNHYGTDFVRYFKGQYVVLIAGINSFQLFTQRSGVKKVFTIKKGNEFYITNDLNLLRNIIEFTPDKTGIINYCLFNNFINGNTLFKEISYSGPASYIWFDTQLHTSSWFVPGSLTEKQIQPLSFFDIAEKMYSIINSAIIYHSKKNTYITLTGGLDSRLALSTLLKAEQKPYAFVYGNPASKDVVFSSKIADSVGIRLDHFFLTNETLPYSQLVNEIIECGNGMIGIHRAHRLFAYKSVSLKNSDDNILFTGHMGGELIRNFYYDGIIIKPFTESIIKKHNIFSTKSQLLHLTSDLFFHNSIHSFLNDSYHGYLNNLPFFSNPQKINELQATFNLLVNVHHAQDLLLAGRYFDIVYPVYMDDEVIDLMFQTGNTFFHNYSKKQGILRSIQGHRFYCELISYLSPELAKIPIGKRGSFTAEEYVHDNRLIFLVKRVQRYLAEKEKYPANYSYGKWFQKYLLQEYISVSKNKVLQEIFDLELFEKQLKEANHKTTEGYWRKYSNIIFIDKVLRHLIPTL